MNIQEIDKWLDNEYGCSYTRLEELHDYFFEKYTDQKEEIERLNNIINEAIEYIEEKYDYILGDDTFLDHDERIERKQIDHILGILNKGSDEISN